MTASDDKTARVWDLATGHSLLLAGHTDEIWNARFSAGGDEVATLSKDSTMRTWDADTGAPRANFVLPAPARQLVVRLDGVLLGGITTGAAWRLRPGASAIELLSDARPRWVIHAADGRHLLVHPDRGEAYLREVDGTQTRPLPGTRDAVGRWFLDRHATVALLLGEQSTELWDLATMQRRVLDVASHTRRPAFTASGEQVAFAVGAEVHVYDTRTATLVHTLAGHEGPVDAVDFSNDDLHLVSGGVDRTVRVWDLGTGRADLHAGFAGLFTEVELLADGRSALALSSAGEVRLFAPRRAGQSLADHGAPASGLALSAAGRIALIDDHGALWIGDLEGRTIAGHMTSRAQGVHLATAPDGRSFAGVARSWVTRADGRHPDLAAPPATLLFGTFDATAPRRVALPAAALDLAWIADGSAVVVALVDGSVLRITTTGAALEVDHFDAAATSVATSADGRWVAAGSVNNWPRRNADSNGVS